MLLFCLEGTSCLRAQPTNSLVRTNSGVIVAPIPPPPKSPVDFFRELLAMTLVERSQALADRPPETRKAILSKVREYQSLKPNQRELRLKATELCWYLLPLMKSDPTNRTWRLAAVPEENRKLVEDRLKEWDQLGNELQQELLKHEQTIRYFYQPTNGYDLPLTNNLSDARRKKLEEGIQQWQALSESERQKLMGRFNQFFELTPEEKGKTLRTLSEADRKQLDKTLHKYEMLSPIQRARCIQSFEKFTNLTLEERQQFLKNVEKWKLMTLDERQAWKELVDRALLQPPAYSPIPPIPPALRRTQFNANQHSLTTSNGY